MITLFIIFVKLNQWSEKINDLIKKYKSRLNNETRRPKQKYFRYFHFYRLKNNLTNYPIFIFNK